MPAGGWNSRANETISTWGEGALRQDWMETTEGDGYIPGGRNGRFCTKKNGYSQRPE